MSTNWWAWRRKYLSQPYPLDGRILCWRILTENSLMSSHHGVWKQRLRPSQRGERHRGQPGCKHHAHR
eukprot:823795-Prorocentrum_lima.AAC.1